jgi:hypothetical protein
MAGGLAATGQVGARSGRPAATSNPATGGPSNPATGGSPTRDPPADQRLAKLGSLSKALGVGRVR